jgi:hypothetical protein
VNGGPTILRGQRGQQFTRPDVPLRTFGGDRHVARMIPRVAIEPSQPGTLGPQSGIYVRLPGADFAPAGAIPVDVIGDASLAPSAVGTLVAITVPDTYTFRIAGIGFGADDEVALGFLTWTIRSFGDVVPGYDNKPAAVGSIRQLADLFVIQGSSSVVTVQASISALAAVTYRYICRVRGWFYSEKEGA